MTNNRSKIPHVRTVMNKVKTKKALVWNIDFLIDDQQRHATWYKIHG